MQTQQWVDKAKSLSEDLNKILGIDEPTAEDLEKAKKVNEDLKALETQISTAEQLQADTAARSEKSKEEKSLIVRPNGWNQSANLDAERALQSKSLGDLFIESKEYKARNGHFSENDPFSTELQLKTLITSGQLAATTPRPDLFRMPPVPPLSILDLIPTVNVTTGAISYYQETSFTNAADFIAEGSQKPESTKVFQQVIAVISKVAHWIPVTTECLADAPFIRGVIDTNLRYGVRSKIQAEILTGSGTAPHLRGIDNTVGIVQSPFATDIPQTILKAITTLESNLANPSAILMNPADWATVRATTGGTPYTYLWGPPTEKGIMTMWGLPVITSPVVAVGWAYVADWSQAWLLVREDVNVFTGLKNDDLIKNILTVVCEARVGFLVLRAPAFAKVDLTLA